MYNASKHSAIQKTFFEIIYKYILKFNLLMTNKMIKYITKQESFTKTESFMN